MRVFSINRLPAFAVLSLCTAIIAGCSSGEQPQPVEEKEPFTKILTASTESMTVDDDQGDSVAIEFDEEHTIWVYGDINSYPVEFMVTSRIGEGKAAFRSLEPVTGLATEGSTFKALLNAPNKKYDGKELTFEVMEKQEFCKNGICYGAVPMAAVGTEDSQSLQFSNLCGLLKLDVKGKGFLQYVKVKGSAPIAGRASVDFTSQGPTMRMHEDGSHKIVMERMGLQLSEEETSVWIVLPPGHYDGVEIGMSAKDPSPFYTIDKTEQFPAFDIERNRVTVRDLHVECTTLGVYSWEGVYYDTFKRGRIILEFHGDKGDGIYYAWITRKEWEEYLAADGRRNEKTYCYNYGEFCDSRVEIIKDVIPETEYVFLEARKLMGKLGSASCAYLRVPPVPKDPEVGIADADISVGADSAAASITFAGDPVRVYCKMFPAYEIQNKTDRELLNETVMADGENVPMDGTFVTTQYWFDMVNYVWCFVVESPEGMSELYKYDVTPVWS